MDMINHVFLLTVIDHSIRTWFEIIVFYIQTYTETARPMSSLQTTMLRNDRYIKTILNIVLIYLSSFNIWIFKHKKLFKDSNVNQNQPWKICTMQMYFYTNMKLDNLWNMLIYVNIFVHFNILKKGHNGFDNSIEQYSL